MKKILTILLLLVSLISFSQEYYRDTTIERAVFNEVNRHRDSMGVHILRFNQDNIRAIPWAETLVKQDLENGRNLHHCGCQAGIEIISRTVIGDNNTITKSVEEIASDIVFSWDVSLAHKKGMENIGMTRGFNAVYIYKSVQFDGRYVALSVYQLLDDKDYYTDLDWDENEAVPDAFLEVYERTRK